MKVYIHPEINGLKIYQYTLVLIAVNREIEIDFVENPNEANVILSYGNNSEIKISKKFYSDLINGIFNHENHFKNDCFIKNEFGEIDYLSTIFYCVNSIQEYKAPSDDFLGRFEFKNSYQEKFSNIKINHVQNCIDSFVRSNVKISNEIKTREKSGFVLTHDIDSVYGSIKEDGMFALKKGGFVDFISLSFRHIIGRADWLNFEKIMKIESEYEFKSIFYWLLKKDNMNADYSFKSKKLQRYYSIVKTGGFESGLHKSLRPDSINDELELMEKGIDSNRFHFLNFTLPEGYNQIERSEIKIDLSLGFTEEYGFRNNYGLPFIPYNLKEDRPFSFLEVPMHIMDRTFFRDRLDVDDVSKELIMWFNENLNNSVFCLNFHNNFFSEFKYRGYIKLYKTLLSYFKETGLTCYDLNQLKVDYYIPQYNLLSNLK